MRFILHINLKTGQQLPVYREQVEPGLIEKAGLLIPIAITCRAPIGIQDWDLWITKYGKCFYGAIATPFILPGVSFHLAGHSKCGANMWRQIDLTSKCQPEPWLAVKWYVDPIEQLNEFISA